MPIIACQCGRVMKRDQKRNMTICAMSDSAHPQALNAADVLNCPGCAIEVYRCYGPSYMLVTDERFSEEYERLRMSETQEMVEVYGE